MIKLQTREIRNNDTPWVRSFEGFIHRGIVHQISVEALEQYNCDVKKEMEKEQIHELNALLLKDIRREYMNLLENVIEPLMKRASHHPDYTPTLYSKAHDFLRILDKGIVE